jgi:hypothetical protein
MKIQPAAPGQGTAARRTASASRGAADGKFASLLDIGATADSHPPAAPGAVQALDNLLAVQEVSDRTGSRKRALSHGQDILDRLEVIRLGLLAGTIPQERLQALVGLLSRSRADFDDPGLRDLIDQIELRAAVELAKLDEI